jgi:hypothetical protein
MHKAETLMPAGSYLQRLRNLGVVANWIERRSARRASVELLNLFWKIRRSRPELAGRPLYEAVVAEHLGSGGGPAALAVSRADASFAQWPRERDVRFRDVVHLLVFEACARQSDGREALQTLVGRVVDRIVPADL